MARYLVTIGLEVHAQVKTVTKMFCACATSYGDEPNTRTCPVCLGLPGALPTLNETAIEKTILAGQLLGCETPGLVRWDRKNYFYPDQAKNYQLSQLDQPLCLGGAVPLHELAYPKDAQKTIARPDLAVRLNRIHLEEDVAKSTHSGKSSRLDFNRAGTPLMEIVTEPDIESAEEAVAYLNALRQILVYGDISDADMEKGQMRCDVNISLRPEGQEELGPKIELKNLNSISAVRRSIHHEIERQSRELDLGIPQEQCTRRWDDDLGESQLLRSKEDAHDYRYFPCPDLLPVSTPALLARVRENLPELPAAKRARFVQNYEVSDYDAAVLASERDLADWFEQAAAGAKSSKRVANWVINEFLGALHTADLELRDSPVTPASLRRVADLVDEKKISNNQGKEVFALLMTGEETDPDAIVRARGFEQVSDTGALGTMVDEVIAANPDKVAEIRSGNDKLVNWLTGQVMKASRGKANPAMVTEMIRQRMRA